MKEINIHSRADEGFSLLGYSAAWIGIWMPTFLRCFLSLGLEQERLFWTATLRRVFIVAFFFPPLFFISVLAIRPAR
jgi:hypothetical protein